MSVFKCKMCGASLEVEDGRDIVKCDYCRTTQTLSPTSDDQLKNLYNRANALRLKCEFDKAEQMYEKILSVADNEAEAYWGIILCRFGIEYVEDSEKGCRIPTCHRTSVEAITADHNYKSAIEHATPSARAVYEQEAAYIDSVQKEILAISAKEAPYDVFICYKESDESGKRTQDSVIANDIYHQLTAEGFKVFYAAITLEDKLGMEYEPVIYAALSSSRVMLAIGTRAEYFNAVWVKNEWSRFLKMMKDDRKKLLIPCYRDMDAYDLPEEFAHLQAQDMSKIGFINDIVRGIGKVLTDGRGSGVSRSKGEEILDTAPLLRRAYLFLEDGMWEDADEYLERVLDREPECSDAYLGQLLAMLKLHTKEALADCSVDFSGSPSYVKAMRFADEGQRDFLKASLASAKVNLDKRIRKEEEERARLEADRQRRDRKDTLSARNSRLWEELSAENRKIAKLDGEIERLKSSIVAGREHAKKRTVGVVLHITGIIVFILSMMLFCIGAPIIAGSLLMTVALLLGAIGICVMLKYDGGTDVNALTISGSVVMMLLFDVSGIMILYRLFCKRGDGEKKYSALIESKELDKAEARRRIERITSEIGGVHDELEDL